MDKEIKETVRQESVSTLDKETSPTSAPAPVKRGRPKGSKDKVPRKRNDTGAKAANKSGNSVAMNVEMKDGDNAKFMALNMALFNMSEINVYTATDEEVEARLNQFFELYYNADIKPTVAGMAMAVGLDRRTLVAIVNDQVIDGNGYKSSLRPSVAGILKKAYKIMENFWEIYMNSGKVNPVTGIFLGKNNFGYQDKTEHVLTPSTKQDEDYDINEIKERYQNQISTDERLSLTDNNNNNSNPEV